MFRKHHKTPSEKISAAIKKLDINKLNNLIDQHATEGRLHILDETKLLILLIQTYGRLAKEYDTMDHADNEYGLHAQSRENNMEKWIKTIFKLLETGIKVNTEDSAKNSILHHFIISGIGTSSGITTFHETKKEWEIELFELLLQLGANPLSINNEGKTPRGLITNTNYFTSSLIKHENARMVNENREISEDRFFYAIKTGEKNIVELYYKQHHEDPACLNVPESKETGTTPLMIAADKQNMEVLIFLSTHGADINAKDIYGNTASVYAIHAESPQREFNANKIMLYLIESGVDVNAQNEEGNSALHYAAHRGSGVTVRTLLKNKADASLINTNQLKASQVIPLNIINRDMIMDDLKIAETRDEEIARLKAQILAHGIREEDNEAGQVYSPTYIKR